MHTTHRCTLAVALSILALATAALRAQPCTLDWSDQFPTGVNDTVQAFAVFDDDGDGPNPSALYLAGGFSAAGGFAANQIARWDGRVFTPLGSSLTAGTVFDLAVFDEDGDGPLHPALFAVGSISAAGGTPVSNIARWDGSSWSRVGDFGLSNPAYALAVHDPDGAGPLPAVLCAGGLFGSADGVIAPHVAQWDGTSWSALGAGFNDFVFDLIEYDADGAGPNTPSLYAAGGFTASAFNLTFHVARWDGVQWVPLRSSPGDVGLDGAAYSLTVFDADGGGPSLPSLCVGGNFTQAGTVPANSVALWDGTNWSALGSGVDGTVWALLEYDEDGAGPGLPGLCAAGTFVTAGGLPAARVAHWSGGVWLPLGSGVNDTVRALATFPDNAEASADALYCGGDFTLSGAYTSNHIARWGCLPSAQAPYIIIEPEDQAPCEGGPATFTVWASGTAPLSYQWYKDGTVIDGAVAASYTIPSAGPDDVAAYSVAVTNDHGTITSVTASLTLGESSIIDTQPQSTDACEGDDVTFNVVATGPGALTYQWHHDGQVIFGATVPSLTVEDITIFDAGDYTVSVTGSCGTITSTPATLTIGPTLLDQPADHAVCEGDSATFCVSVNTGIPPFTYEWYRDGTILPGAPHDACYVFDQVSATDAGEYWAAVTNSCGTAYSATAELTVADEAPVIDVPPADQTICAGESATFCVTLAGGTPPFSYAWSKDGVPIAGAPDDACFTIDPATAADAGVYSVSVSNGCAAPVSASAALTVKEPPAIDTHPASQSVSEGDPVTLCVTLAAGSPPLTYEWRFDGTPIAGAPDDACFTIAAMSPADAGSYTVAISNACGSVESDAALVTVDQTPIIANDPDDLTVCAGDVATFCVTLLTGTPPLTYEWLLDGTPIAGAPDDACYTIDPTDAADAGAYSVRVSNAYGSTTSAAATLTLGSAPQIGQDPQDQTVVLGDPATFCVDVTGGTPPPSYTWYHNSQPISGAPDADCLTIPSTAVTDAGNYSVAVTNSCGTIFSATATLTIAQPPTIADHPTTKTVCAGDAATFCVTLAGGTPPFTFTWRRDGIAIPGAPNADCFTIDPIELSDVGAYSVRVSNAYGSVVSTTAPLTVNACSHPAMPSNPNPADDAVDVVVNTTLQWSPAADADEYWIYFGTNDAPPLVAIRPGTSWPPPPLLHGQRYHWQVVAVNDFGTSAGPVWTFTTAARTPEPVPPDAPLAVYPPIDAVGVPIDFMLDWSDAARATSYTVYLGDRAFARLGSTSESEWPIDGLEPNTKYYWTIIASNAGGRVVGEGTIWSFTTAAAATSPEPSDPNSADPNDPTRPAPTGGVCPLVAAAMLSVTLVGLHLAWRRK